MSKHLYLLVLMLITTTFVHAQKGFHIGVSGTFNSTWILNQNNYGTLAPFQISIVRQSEMDYKPTWGGNAGVVVGYNFTKNWGIQAEIQYSTAGQIYQDAFLGPAYIPQDSFPKGKYIDVKRRIELGYIQVPIMAKFISSKGEIAKFFMCLGPQIGIRTNAKESVEIGGYTYLPDSLAYKPGDKFKPVDIGVALQLGTEIYATDHLYFDIGLSTYCGLNDLNGKVLKELGWYSQNDVDYQKSYNFRVGIMAGVHYVFGEGRSRW